MDYGLWEVDTHIVVVGYIFGCLGKNNSKILCKRDSNQYSGFLNKLFYHDYKKVKC